MINNIRNNTNSEISAKNGLNTLNKITNPEIKYKRLIPKHKELLNLFNDLLDIILTDKTLESESQEDENGNKNDNDKKLMPSKDENENQDEDEDGDETMSQNEKNETITKK